MQQLTGIMEARKHNGIDVWTQMKRQQKTEQWIGSELMLSIVDFFILKEQQNAKFKKSPTGIQYF